MAHPRTTASALARAVSWQDKLKIPFAYFERMRGAAERCWTAASTTWLQKEEERRMLRTLDGHVRAVLSDRYRRLDDWSAECAADPAAVARSTLRVG